MYRISGYYKIIEKTKDVITLDIQQYRVSAHFSAVISDHL